MPRLNPIWLAIPSFGALIGVARADPQSCPSRVIPSLLPHTSATSSKQKPRTEKSVATGGDVRTSSPQLTSALYSQAGICGFEQVEVSAAWPIAGHWNVFAREVYSLQDKLPLESFAGFEYGACCWRVRFGLRRYISRRPETTDSTSAGPQDTAAWLQLELTGLAGVGSATDAFLTDEIRGYAPSEVSSKKLFNGP